MSTAQQPTVNLKSCRSRMTSIAASLTLSTNGLSHVPLKESGNDFKFIAGDATYCCPSLIADFLSPKIAQIHSIDDTIVSFAISAKDVKGDFSSIMGLGRGQPVVLTESNRTLLESVCKDLLSVELYEKILQATEGTISVDNVASRMKSVAEMRDRYEGEAEFAG
jgi:hypothetical protein